MRFKQHILHICIVLLMLLFPHLVFGQKNPYWSEPKINDLDSLKSTLAATIDDHEKLHLYRQLGLYYSERDRFIAFEYFSQLLRQAEKLNQIIWEAEAYSRMGYISSLIQNYPGSLNYLLEAREIISDPSSSKGMWGAERLDENGDTNEARLTVQVDIHNHLGILNYFVGDYPAAIDYYDQAGILNEVAQEEPMKALLYMNKAAAYYQMGMLDLAKSELEKSLVMSESSGYTPYIGLIYHDIGKILEDQGNYIEAEDYFQRSIRWNLENESPDFLGMGYLALAELLKSEGNLSASYSLAREALLTYRIMKDSIGLINTHATLASVFDASKQVDSAYHYMKEGAALVSAMNKEKRAREFQILGLNKQLELKQVEAEKALLQSRTRVYGLVAGIGVLLLISAITYRSSVQQKRDKAIIEQSYENLKSTQAQLIHAEKMASLGELTAGIAHEIQNPLNFVNNFSELNREMLEELREEAEKGDLEEVKALAGDVIANEEKITHHGKRADAIVKGMLAHSRTNSGEKVETDINALADEYLRLSYHGLRAKDHGFNAEFKTDFDSNLPKVKVIPQDIGRVLLNLINNAFQACTERIRSGLVTVSTKNLGDQIQISVSDNGPGIPDTIKDKIFQPFFTTKPTGQGTGLGLSLSYDIVKAHGGELRVESEVGEGTQFIIALPFKINHIS
jgi:two-component system NtrC family sensor kinase